MHPRIKYSLTSRLTFFVFISATLLISACQKDHKASLDGTDKTTAIVLADRQLNTFMRADSVSVQTIAPGTGLVFSYTQSHSAPYGVQDGGSFQSFSFHVGADTDQFELRDQDLVTAHCYLSGQAVPGPATHVYPDSGTIQGVKINKTQWKVKLHVVFPPPAALPGSPLGKFDLETVYTLQP